MDKQNISDLVGKSFEELSIEEMEKMQGAANIEARSTPATTLAATAASAAISGALSGSVSIAITFIKKCKM
ncbi:lichenicidin A2 family type 2 lantibiotic [Lactococcus lactis]|jgi:CylL-L protein|uniref:lichenicidin A2 family type 2 lantibiotic n=1 Tax=Lactococcus lactis TaxID=1358 RepID=UPI0020555FDE|nr:lichenicidin A2 family type 2 lantibiotic [Lactococcus lactis]MDG4973404.1 lichenicidin A2 family type 2 lantibiotic [Lactococcus lactis]BDH82206.1 hypothetical protein LLL8_18630 [Lactococcus lactis]